MKKLFVILGLVALLLPATATAGSEHRVLLASAERTVDTYTANVITPPWAEAMVLWLDQTACTGTCTANLNMRVQVYNPTTDTWVQTTELHVLSTTAPGAKVVVVHPGGLAGDYHTDVTYSNNFVPGHFRVFIDVNSADTVTYSLDVIFL